MRAEIGKLHKRLETTFIYVTHDQTEAMTMGSRIVVMKDGIVQQCASPTELYDEPVNMFVAGFIGSPQMNFVTCDVNEKGEDIYLEFAQDSIKLPQGIATKVKSANCVGKQVILGVRPEDLHDEEAFLSLNADAIVTADVEVTEMMGAETYLYVKVADNNFTARVDPRSTAKVGDTIKLGVDVNKIHLFDKETELAIL